MAGSVIGAVAGGLASSAASSIFGGGSSGQQAPATLTRLYTPGLRYEPVPGGGQRQRRVVRTEEVEGLLGELRGAGETANQRFGDLLSRVAPGFSDMRAAREASIRDTFNRERSQAVGSLRENLARRSVLGSSFAESALGQTRSAFADAEARALAESNAQSLLEEIDLTQRLATQDFNISSSVVQGLLDQGRFETTSAINLANGTQMAMAESAKLQQELAIANAQGAGAFFQPAIDAVGKGVGDFVSGLFN